MLHLFVAISLLMLAASLLLALVRLVVGPTLPDRVLCLDLLATIAVAVVAVYAMKYDTPMLLDVAAVLALVAFMSTVAFSLYLQRRVQR